MLNYLGHFTNRKRSLEEFCKRLELTDYQLEAGSDLLTTDYGEFALTWLPCHYGGHRAFFSCPGCGSRVRKLYRPLRSHPFLCRLCHKLAYRSENLTKIQRLETRMVKRKLAIKKRLGIVRVTILGDPAIYSAHPKGIREKTRRSLVREYKDLEINSILVGMFGNKIFASKTGSKLAKTASNTIFKKLCYNVGSR